MFTSIVVWVLVLLSVILTASIVFPTITGGMIMAILAGGTLLGAYLLVRYHHYARPPWKSGC